MPTNRHRSPTNLVGIQFSTSFKLSISIFPTTVYDRTRQTVQNANHIHTWQPGLGVLPPPTSTDLSRLQHYALRLHYCLNLWYPHPPMTSSMKSKRHKAKAAKSGSKRPE